MAPAISSAMTLSREHLPLNIKLRKPVVEKMRRDRINSSIEQLRTLLASEFLNQQSDSKLEKADILEMTVSFLKQKCANSSSSAPVNQGFSRCVHEVVNFLSSDDVQKQSQRKLLDHFQKLQLPAHKNNLEGVMPQLCSTSQQTMSEEKSLVKTALWRPW